MIVHSSASQIRRANAGLTVIGRIFAVAIVFTMSVDICLGSLVSAVTSDSGNKRNLASVTLSDGRTVGIGTGLIGIDVFHFRVTAATVGVSTVLNSPDPASSIPAGSRAALLDGDAALNTGLANIGDPGDGTRLIPGTSPIPTSIGMGIIFQSPVVNGPGEDVIFFEVATRTEERSDSFTISALGGGSGYSSTSFKSTGFNRDSYSLEIPLLSYMTFTMQNPVAGLADLESKALTQGISAASPVARGIAIDLEALGVPPNGSATGLFIEGPAVDPSFIAGISRAPEPSSIVLGLLGAIGFLILLRGQSS